MAGQAGDTTLEDVRARVLDRDGRDPLADYAILDTPGEEKFDAAAEVAARLAGAPIGLISFVTATREWVKASHGGECGQVERQRSFAGALADAAAATLVVPDATADSRFAGHPWVAHGPRARFYAGVPLRTPSGCTIGSLAVLDTEPRADGDEVAEALPALARTLEGMLEGRREGVLGGALTAVIGSDGRFIRVSGAWEDLLGYPAAEITGRPYLDFVHPEDVSRTMAEDATSRAGRGTMDYENRYVSRDGSVHWLSWLAKPVADEGVLYTVAKDITALKESERRYRLLAENATDMIGQWDLEARLVYLSSASKALLGYAPEELVGRYGYELIHPADATAVIAYHEALLRGNDRVRVAFRIRHRDGHWVWTETVGRILLDDDGNSIGIQTATRDMTDARRALEALQRAEERFRQAFEEGPVGMAIINLDASFQRVNRALGELLRHEPDDLVGRSVIDMLPDGHDAALGATLIAGERDRVTVERRFARGDGSDVWVTLNVSVMHDADGNPTAFLVHFLDMSERHRAEAESRRAREAAERANRAKSEFLARMSHELRTPLNAIMGFAQLLQLDELCDDQRESAERIVRGGRHLLEVINDVLDISRIEAGEMPIELAPVDVAEALDEAVSLVGPLAAERRISVRMDVPGAHVHARADRQRLVQVALNLVSNAIKYGPRESEVLVRLEASGDHVRICVADEGEGVTPEQAERIFQPFERLEQHVAFEGTGLGLALSRNLVRAMGGDIRVRGSEFSVELHATEAAPAPASPEEPPALAGALTGTLLYIEDSSSNTALMERLLRESSSVELIVAGDGASGVAAARERRPDAIVLDMTLPDMDGTQVLEQLRADPVTAALPVLAVSADVAPERESAARAAGAASYLSKPVDLGVLLTELEKVLQPE